MSIHPEQPSQKQVSTPRPEKAENELLRKYWWVPFSVVIALWLLIGAVMLLCLCGSDDTAWAKIGQSGDMFGSINTLFSGLAFAGVLLALWMQRLDLNLQRKEMHDTREEMEKQTNELKEQTQIQKEAQRTLEKNYIREQMEKAHEAELHEAYRLIDITHCSIHNFVLTADSRYACGEVISEETIAIQEATKTEGVYTFSYLWKRAHAYLTYLSSEKRTKDELVKLTREIYACCDLASGIAYNFSRAVTYVLAKAEHLKETERGELISYLFSSHINEVEAVILSVLEGDIHYPRSHKWLKPLTTSYILSTHFPNLPITVKTAFIHVLRARTSRPRNKEKIADEVELILQSEPTNDANESSIRA